MEKRECGTCQWYDRETEVCCNGRSDYRGISGRTTIRAESGREIRHQRLWQSQNKAANT